MIIYTKVTMSVCGQSPLFIPTTVNAQIKNIDAVDVAADLVSTKALVVNGETISDTWSQITTSPTGTTFNLDLTTAQTLHAQTIEVPTTGTTTTGNLVVTQQANLPYTAFSTGFSAPVGTSAMANASVTSDLSVGGNISMSGSSATATLKSTTASALTVTGTSTLSTTNVTGTTTMVGNVLASKSGAGTYALALGYNAAQTTQGNYAVAAGYYAGNSGQGVQSVAIGNNAGRSTQATSAVAVGDEAGRNTQGNYAVAIGYQAGLTSQGAYCVAIGDQAGKSASAAGCVAVGQNAGTTSQGTGAIAIGKYSGKTQGEYSTALGFSAGETSQAANTVALGAVAGNSSQGEFAVAVGVRAGLSGQGASSIAVGYKAGETAQGANTIVLNATGATLNTTGTDRFHVAPVRGVDCGLASGALYYDSTNKEIQYSTSTGVSGYTTLPTLTHTQIGYTAIYTPTANVTLTSETAVKVNDGNLGYLPVGIWRIDVCASIAVTVSGSATVDSWVLGLNSGSTTATFPTFSTAVTGFRNVRDSPNWTLGVGVTSGYNMNAKTVTFSQTLRVESAISNLYGVFSAKFTTTNPVVLDKGSSFVQITRLA